MFIANFAYFWTMSITNFAYFWTMHLKPHSFCLIRLEIIDYWLIGSSKPTLPSGSRKLEARSQKPDRFPLIRLCVNDIGSYNRNNRYSRYNCIIATTAKCHLYEQQCIQRQL